MPTREDIENALRNADAAGDVDAARTLAAALQQSAPQPKKGLSDIPSMAWEDIKKAGKGIYNSVVSGVTLPHDVMQEAMKPPPTTISDSDVGPLSAGRVLELGTLINPVNPGVRAGERAIPGGARAAESKIQPKAPTTEELRAAGASDINAAKNSGLEVTSSSVGDWSRKVQSELFDAGIHPVDAPNTFAKLKELENAPAGSFATASGLQSLRESLGHTAQNFNPNAAKDQLAASRAIRGLDGFIPNVAEKDVLAGAPSATAKLFERGRANYGAAMRSNDLTGALDRANTGILERAEVRAQAANSGRNLDNTIRSKVASLLEKPKEVSGFSDKELDALGGVVAGGPARNTARYIGNLLGAGGGVGQSGIAALGAGGGAAVGGVPGALIGGVAPAVAGAGSKTIANALAKRSLNKADELVRKRSPLFEEALANAETIPTHLSKKEAIAKLLLMDALSGRGSQ
jgi:hypothetical protein